MRPKIDYLGDLKRDMDAILHFNTLNDVQKVH